MKKKKITDGRNRLETTFPSKRNCQLLSFAERVHVVLNWRQDHASKVKTSIVFSLQNIFKRKLGMKFVCAQPHRDLHRKKTQPTHLHKRLWRVSFSIQLDREWTSSLTHSFLIILMLTVASHYFCYQSPTACIFRLWSAKAQGMKSPLIKKVLWYCLAWHTNCYRFKVWPQSGCYSFHGGRGKSNNP